MNCNHLLVRTCGVLDETVVGDDVLEESCRSLEHPRPLRVREVHVVDPEFQTV